MINYRLKVFFNFANFGRRTNTRYKNIINKKVFKDIKTLGAVKSITNSPVTTTCAIAPGGFYVMPIAPAIDEGVNTTRAALRLRKIRQLNPLAFKLVASSDTSCNNIMFREKAFSKPLEQSLYKFFQLTGKKAPGSKFKAGRKAIETGKKIRVKANNIAENPGRFTSNTVGGMVDSPVNGTITAAAPGGIIIGLAVKPVTEYIDKPIRKLGPEWIRKNIYDKGVNKAVEASTNWLIQIPH